MPQAAGRAEQALEQTPGREGDIAQGGEAAFGEAAGVERAGARQQRGREGGEEAALGAGRHEPRGRRGRCALAAGGEFPAALLGIVRGDAGDEAAAGHADGDLEADLGADAGAEVVGQADGLVGRIGVDDVWYLQVEVVERGDLDAAGDVVAEAGDLAAGDLVAAVIAWQDAE